MPEDVDSPPSSVSSRVAPRGRGRSRIRTLIPARLRRPLIWALRGTAAVVLMMAGYVGVTIYPYLSAPGTDSVAARIAEWGRDHHLSWAVTWLEDSTYHPAAHRRRAHAPPSRRPCWAASPRPRIRTPRH